ncbi:TetR/AcrR family transcriptional regulator [Polymorphobacter fuscus]|nr:TetR/AcrR family transcriptional regulator [Polymorphobacter fuscus]NJC09900.1 AcrR family transcriptional regulator [Polymorphobacter fuscus]
MHEQLDTYLRAKAKPAANAPEPAPRSANPQRRDAILDVARQVFLESGYEGASMSQIAVRLGGSKGTLYSYFDSKEALFEALIADTCARTREAVFDTPADLPLRESLRSIAVGYIRLIMSDYTVRMFQIIAAESQRWPALGARLYEAGPAAAAARLGTHLDQRAGDAGLSIPDSLAAAQTFLTLCRGALHLQRVLGIAAEPDDAAIDSHADKAVTAFWRLYAA